MRRLLLLKQKTKRQVQLRLLISKLAAQLILFTLLSDIIEKVIDFRDISKLVTSRADLIHFELKNFNQVNSYLKH